MKIQDRLISIIQPGQALLSLRDSGYNFPTAIAEVIDNSIEANANNINIRLFENKDKNGKKCIDRVAIADDGFGMNIDVLHHYLVIGQSSRYMQIDTIGKYGVGAKLAALNFSLRIDAWSRTTPDEPWRHVSFDLEEAVNIEKKNQGKVGVSYPEELDIPEDYLNLLASNTGTLVVWSKVDRLENGRAASNSDELKAELTKELGRIFREFINNGIKINLDGKDIIHHDPLMLMENSWADILLTKELKKNSFIDTDKRDYIKHFSPTVIAEKVSILSINGKNATLTVTLYPKEITRLRGKGRDTLAKKLRVPDNQGCISFMRLGREIAYTSVPRIFSRAVDEPDRFIGIEVNFTPDFDDYFGVRNVKRGVEPFDSLRTRIRDDLKTHLETARKLLDEAWSQAAKNEKVHARELGGIEGEIATIDKLMPKSRVKLPKTKEKEQQALDDELSSLADDIGKNSSNDEKLSYKESKKNFPFVVENVSFPGKSFIDVKHVNNKVIIRINTRHRFYREMWKPLYEIAELDPGSVNGHDAVKTARRAVEGLTLMILAFGKAQTMFEDPYQYEDFTAFWGQFIDTMMGKIKDAI